jgi:hypothetical protein
VDRVASISSRWSSLGKQPATWAASGGASKATSKEASKEARQEGTGGELRGEQANRYIAGQTTKADKRRVEAAGHTA